MDTSASSLLRIAHGSSALPSQRLCGRKATARPQRVRIGAGGFADQGHVRYYASMGRTKEEKKRRKLAENVSRDLSELIRTGFGLEDRSVVDREGEGSERMSISEAAELLLAQLEKVRVQEKEVKIKTKKEGKCMMKKKDCDESSSSSSSESSESSDSDCEEEVVDMSTFRTNAPVDVTPVAPATTTLVPKNEKQQILKEALPKSTESLSSICVTECTCTSITKNTVASNTTLADRGMLPPLPSPVLSAVAVTRDRVEVCMGGKCKKSGGLQLMEEFERHIGAEGRVVGCKCLGKCKEGPNIRVVNHTKDEEASATKQRNPLCIGVGLEDVRAIVGNYFGERALGIQSC